MEKKKFTVEVTETLQRQITVEAEDANDALIIARHMYNDEEIVLDYNDFVGTDIKVLQEKD